MESLVEELNVSDPVQSFIIMLNERIGSLETKLESLTKIIIGSKITSKIILRKTYSSCLTSAQYLTLPTDDYIKRVLSLYYQVDDVEITNDTIVIEFSNNVVLHEVNTVVNEVFQKYFPHVYVEKWKFV